MEGAEVEGERARSPCSDGVEMCVRRHGRDKYLSRMAKDDDLCPSSDPFDEGRPDVVDMSMCTRKPCARSSESARARARVVVVVVVVVVLALLCV